MLAREQVTSEDVGVHQPYRLRLGDAGPVQQWPVSCGASCLTVARMLVHAPFASWVRTGEPRLPGLPDLPAAASVEERFAAYEKQVMRRTNGAWAWSRPSIPWPHGWGTPPWGARRELERNASREGTRYEIVVLPRADREALVRCYGRLVDVVAEGEPGILYVGNQQVPRHLVLVLPGDGDRTLDVYDPADGRVRHLRRDEFVEHRLRMSGWDHPHLLIQPTGARLIRLRVPRARRSRVEPEATAG